MKKTVIWLISPVSLNTFKKMTNMMTKTIRILISMILSFYRLPSWIPIISVTKLLLFFISFEIIPRVLVRKSHLFLIYVENYLSLKVIVGVVKLIVKNNRPSKLMIFMAFVGNWFKLCLSLRIRFTKLKENKVRSKSKGEILLETFLNKKFSQDWHILLCRTAKVVGVMVNLNRKIKRT